MKQLTIKNIFPAYRNNIADLKTVRPIPSSEIEILDPFLFLNHHGPQVYPKNNKGLPFTPHPHRGFQTVTFIISGDIAHKDSDGHQSVITAGGVQWMSAGRGIIHEEVSSENFKTHGGELEVLQLWINLPAKLKMTDPYYLGLQKKDIPEVFLDQNKVRVQVISGNYDQTSGPFRPSTDITTLLIKIKINGSFNVDVPQDHQIFFYVVKGEVLVCCQSIKAMNLVEFNFNGQQLHLAATSDALVLLCHAKPYKEPVVFGGPFVMNTEGEIKTAFADLKAVRF